MRALMIVSILLPAVLSGQEKADQRIEPAATVPGGKVLEWTTPEGQPYWYRVPKEIRKDQPPDLVIMLHGTGLKWGWAFWNYPIQNGGFRGDDVVVAPEGLTPGQGGTFNFVQGKKDGDQIAGLISLFRKKMPIGKVYLYGHSQGAFFCYWFAGEHPDLVDGIVAHAGNVLDVKHSKLAKQKVAIGILHGRADAVVPVECAFRTEKVYQDEGYEKVKLHVVEGLTEQSGHWPLPKQVADMFTWLDQVSTSTPAQAVAAALAALEGKEPDLAAAAAGADRAEGLLKKARDPAAAESLKVFREFLAAAAAAHAAALGKDPALADPKMPLGAWAGHFLAVDAALDGVPAWTEAMKAPRVAAKPSKAVEKAIKDLNTPDRKAFTAGTKALAESFLAPRASELHTALQRALAEPPKGVTPAEIEAAKKILDERASAIEKGRAAALAVTVETLAAFRATRPGFAEAAGSK